MKKIKLGKKQINYVSDKDRKERNNLIFDAQAKACEILDMLNVVDGDINMETIYKLASDIESDLDIVISQYL